MTNQTRSTAQAGASSTTKDPAQIACATCKRFVLAVVNLVTLIITAIYITSAINHSQTIDANTALLKQPYGAFDLQLSKIAWSFGIARVVYLALTLFLTIGVPDQYLFVSGVVQLIFEIPMALVADSNYGYRVSYAKLVLPADTIFCYPNLIAQDAWSFYTAYASLVGRPTRDVCQEFVLEGNLLRASLLFSWFALWISFFLIAAFCAIEMQDRKWSNLLICFTGFEVSYLSWNGTKRLVARSWERVRLPRWRLRRVKSETVSDASTLADEVIEFKAGEKVAVAV